ncbi:Suppressor-of-White-APricot splicing regulator superfamily domain-containing protein [Histoplasma capsulatum]|uniref:Suppressor-of-White-APricot splicing regulator superfamily domain-containing protein n=1 Tax=Ajellomyces capsulatus TaxID=5037 RepID=A0A8A1MDN6_AJECA|nr:predicted protein [Histoplasma mississippiense (nom. inval.)]EDN02266.1 predicted protein [Histoplasma mississippiense (nom. inval.)]QSS64708.1 Suppressor-of-White-APricot splicing regulator superfamily domain-containing protein [Histoplasma capsulatum]
MPEDSKAKGFLDLSSKLSAPAKKSLFERQKAEAEAKRAREKAETEAVYEDFVKSFQNDADTPTGPGVSGRVGSYGRGGAVHSGAPVAPSKRHFTSSTMRSAPDNQGAPHSFGSRKRPFEAMHSSHKERDVGHGPFSFENSPPAHADAAAAFQVSDDEDKLADKKEAERAAAKPTLHLSSLPPGTSPAVVKALVSHALVVDNVKILPATPQGTGTGERRVWSAIVTLAKETAATEMDTVVSSLQNKYLGWGYYLSISRHLSSAAINSTMPITTISTTSTSKPFGARPITQGSGGNYGRGPPGGHRGGFAPPSSYGPGYGGRGGSTLQVEVKPPSDLKQLKLIHKTLENLLTYGPEFEALLMSRPEVQKNEKWAWIWDSRSPGGVWYRWKLWDILTGARKTRGRHPPTPTSVFESGPVWLPPENHLQFEYVTKIEEFISDEDYDSSEEDDSDREDEKRLDSGAQERNSDGIGHLNPLQKAKLAHLLAKLPTTNSKLRRGDVARITSFAIRHAGCGADEVVEMIVANITNPLAFTNANPERQRRETELRGGKPDDGDEANPAEHDSQTAQSLTKKSSKETLDTSASKLVGLYLISDILSSSSTSGVRHAWRYRQLFESSLKTHKIFEHLGRLEKELGWGRLKIEKWRRSITSLLSLWEGWCVFPQSSQEHFVQVFEKPPLTEKEKLEEQKRVEAEKTSGVFGSKGKSRWRTVEDDANEVAVDTHNTEDVLESEKMDIDDGDDGVPMLDDEDIDGEPMDDDIDGVPMEDSDMEDVETKQAEGNGMDESERQGARGVSSHGSGDQTASDARHTKEAEHDAQPAPRRRRPKAEDMFADSDSD